MASSNKTCQVCQENDATHFCNCLDPPTLFCLDCSARHSAKFPRIIHQTIPMVVMQQNPEEYMHKYQTLNAAVAELRKNVERLDQFCREFEELIPKFDKVPACVPNLVASADAGRKRPTIHDD